MVNLKFLEGYEKNLVNDKHTLISDKVNSSFGPFKAVFFDRDGILNKECHYLSKEDDVCLEDGVVFFLRQLKKLDWKIIVVTNQSGISRGLYSWNDYEKVTNKLLKLIGDKNLIDAIYANGYKEYKDKYSWRKPGIGMIKDSAKKLNVDLNISIIIGDRLTDLKAGINANLAHCIHLLTGHGKKERGKIQKYINNKQNNMEIIKSNLILSDNLFDLHKNQIFQTN